MNAIMVNKFFHLLILLEQFAFYMTWAGFYYTVDIVDDGGRFREVTDALMPASAMKTTADISEGIIPAAGILKRYKCYRNFKIDRGRRPRPSGYSTDPFSGNKFWRLMT